MRQLPCFIAALVILSAIICHALHTTEQAPKVIPPDAPPLFEYIKTARPDYTKPQQVEMLVRLTFDDTPILVEVARCESTFRQFNADGSVLRGHVDPRDTGVMQINTHYHARAAEALGLDLEDISDNLKYAKHLYKNEGTQPWSASSNCWG